MTDNSNSSSGSGSTFDITPNVAQVDKNSAELSKDAASKSMDGSDARDLRRPFTFESSDYDRTEAPKDEMRKYWRQFETTPIVRKPITSFASRVTEPGYFIETKKLERSEVEKIGNWLNQAAILEGQPGRDFRLLAKKAIVQREVRGTSLVEVAPHKDDPDKIAGLKLINAETMEAVTRPNQKILMAPDDINEYDSAPKAESGGAAAWLQDILETDNTYWGEAISGGDASNDEKIGFRRDEIIPMTRDADVGEVFGTSRIEAVADRVDGIKQKLADNDEAIASKAYPLWLFMFGSEENPWDSGEIASFMQHQEMENFHPGMKQGVRGDVEVETISGEVADIAEALNFDLQWIMSAMPMPLFTLGAFGGTGATVGQVSGVAQQQDVNRQIKEARRELEEEFTPVVRKVAMQQGVDEERAKDITLKFGTPGETDLNVDRNEQVIRYISNSQGGETQTQGQQPDMRSPEQRQSVGDGANGGQSSGEGEDVDPAMDVTGADPDEVITKGETPESVNNPTPDIPMAGVDSDKNIYVDYETESNRSTEVWNTSRTVSELASYDDERSQIAELAYSVFQTAMDNTLSQLGERYASTPQYAVSEFENVANRELNRAIREQSTRNTARDTIRTLLDEELESLGVGSSPYRDTNVSFFAQNIENAIRDAAEEMLRKARLQMRHAIVTNESFNSVTARIESDYSDAYLRERAQLIAHMETKDAVESTKLKEFQRNDEIVGFSIENTNPSTGVTQSLNGEEIYFDESESLRESVEGRLATSPKQGFDPLPTTPPYHFNDTTTIEPIWRD
jgi:hypothetical protein